jgi:hypothetical protein
VDKFSLWRMNSLVNAFAAGPSFTVKKFPLHVSSLSPSHFFVHQILVLDLHMISRFLLTRCIIITPVVWAPTESDFFFLFRSLPSRSSQSHLTHSSRHSYRSNTWGKRRASLLLANVRHHFAPCLGQLTIIAIFKLRLGICHGGTLL